MTMNSYGWIVYGLGYYELFPDLKCGGDSLQTSTGCTAKFICDQTNNKPILNQDYFIDYQPSTSLHNLF